ncbi:uroporphyrinogen decarboxylase [Phaeodactylibacter xiamenensis]|uniref:uroporphyrinogen decarboxylase n=1 Tax=Phaeodactylibacter xiamenensis TaxID=1524460 RepID=UPI003BAB16E9
MSTKNDLFLRTARGEAVERPPVWLMRQAGRILPQYRAIRNRLSGFKELVETPELAAEVTIQPVDELNVDAAIIFSDILVIPEAMGLTYEMVEKRGPLFPEVIKSEADVQKLTSGADAAAELQYVYDAVALTRQQLDGRVPLIGFSGAPWTLLAYMVEGSGSKTFSKAKKLLYTDPKLAHQLLEKISETVIAYLKLKVESGAQLVQVFDSWAGILSPAQYREFALPYIKVIAESITDVPVTVFSKGAWFVYEDLGQVDCQVVGLDWNTPPELAREWIGPDKVLQGNLDPCQLYAPPEEVAKAAVAMLDRYGRGHIANLGHGVYPDTPLEGVKAFVNAVRAYQYK